MYGFKVEGFHCDPSYFFIIEIALSRFNQAAICDTLSVAYRLFPSLVVVSVRCTTPVGSGGHIGAKESGAWVILNVSARFAVLINSGVAGDLRAVLHGIEECLDGLSKVYGGRRETGSFDGYMLHRRHMPSLTVAQPAFMAVALHG